MKFDAGEHEAGDLVRSRTVHANLEQLRGPDAREERRSERDGVGATITRGTPGGIDLGHRSAGERGPGCDRGEHPAGERQRDRAAHQ